MALADRAFDGRLSTTLIKERCLLLARPRAVYKRFLQAPFISAFYKRGLKAPFMP